MTLGKGDFLNSTQVRVTVPEGIDAGLITGPQDSLIRALEKRARAEITVRGATISITGPARCCEALVKLFEHLLSLPPLVMLLMSRILCAFLIRFSSEAGTHRAWLKTLS